MDFEKSLIVSLRTRYALRASSILGNGEQRLRLGSAEVGDTAVVKGHGAIRTERPSRPVSEIRLPW